MKNKLEEEKLIEQEKEAEIEQEAKLLFKHNKLHKIESFTTDYSFLSMDYPAEAYFQGFVYSTASAAYHAARAPDEKMRNIIHKCPTLASMHDIARTIQDPPDWQLRRLKVMDSILRDKFRRHRDLKELLLKTQNNELINTLSEDTSTNLFWGCVEGKGQNQLGRLLENIRQDIADGRDLEHWLFSIFEIQNSKKLVPHIILQVFKSEEHIENITFSGKGYFIMGSLQDRCDYQMRHPSISRQHAAIVVDKTMGVVLIDAGSKAGTVLNGEGLKPLIPYPIKNEDAIKFADSSRSFKVSIDYTDVKRMYEIEKKALDKDMQLLGKLDEVDPSDVHKTLGIEKNDTIFIGNLPYSMQEEETKKIFENCGEIKSIRMPEDRRTKRKKGFAFITFKEEAAAGKAVMKDGIMVYDRKIHISYAEKRRSRSKSRSRSRSDSDSSSDSSLSSKHKHHHKRHHHKHSSSSSSSR